MPGLERDEVEEEVNQKAEEREAMNAGVLQVFQG